MADTRSVELAPTIKTKVFTTLANKLEESCAFNDGTFFIQPAYFNLCLANLPYIDSIAKHFSYKAMKNTVAVRDS